jgi:hypothetical protein
MRGVGVEEIADIISMDPENVQRYLMSRGQEEERKMQMEFDLEHGEGEVEWHQVSI